MSTKDLIVKSAAITNEKVARYVNQKITVDSPLEARLREATTRFPNGGMISSSDVGALLAILARTANARNALEIGTFTGYTALKIAGALPADGKLICCDVSDEWTRVGKPFWKEAGLDGRIDLRLAPAMDTLNSLLAEGKAGTFDFAFVDADKRGYGDYYEACLKLLRPGGVIVLDNMLWDGAVADENDRDGTTAYLRELNSRIGADPRVHAALLTVGDGLMVASKK